MPCQSFSVRDIDIVFQENKENCIETIKFLYKNISQWNNTSIHSIVKYENKENVSLEICYSNFYIPCVYVA